MTSGAFLASFIVAVVGSAVSPAAAGDDLMRGVVGLSRLLELRNEAAVLTERGRQRPALCVAAVQDIPDNMVSLKTAELMCLQEALSVSPSNSHIARGMVEVDRAFDLGQDIYAFAFQQPSSSTQNDARLRRLVADAISQKIESRKDDAHAIAR